MADQPALHTSRLVLRPFGDADVSRFARLAGSREVSDTMISVPHPFTERMALETVREYAAQFAKGTDVHFAVAEPPRPDDFVGYVGIHHIDREHLEGELSFWMGESTKGRGFTTEAAGAAMEYGFGALGLNRICAFHMVKNQASRRVLERIGMQLEGRLRERVRKHGAFEDVLVWAALRADAANRQPSNG